MEKLVLMEWIFKKLAQNGFHELENQFPLTRMKNLLKNKFTLDEKKALPNRIIWKIDKKNAFQ